MNELNVHLKIHKLILIIFIFNKKPHFDIHVYTKNLDLFEHLKTFCSSYFSVLFPTLTIM